MAINTDINQALLEDLLGIYNEAEHIMAEKVAKRVANGITEQGWNETHYTSVQSLRDDIQATLNDAEKMAASKVGPGILKAYKDGVNAAEVDLGRKVTLMKDLFISAPMQNLLLSTNKLLKDTHVQVLRQVEDMYRQVQSEATTMLLTGVETRVQASQRMLNKFADNGITSFIDKAGRTWNLASYSEMAVRTVSGHAALQGHMDKLEDLGQDLVKVSTIGATCKICARWQGVVLSISGKTPGYITVDQARSQGLFHPNCKHTIVMYDEELDGPGQKEPKPAIATKAEVEKYNQVQKQRSNERQIRYWKRRKDLAITPTDNTKATQKIKEWQQKNLLHCEKNNLKRQYYREGNMVGKMDKSPDLLVGGHLWEYEELFEQAVGVNPKAEFIKQSASVQSQGYEKWIRKEIKSLDDLDIDRKNMSLTEVYKKYIGDTPSQDFKALGITDKSYAKWLKEQVEDIGKGYTIKPEVTQKVIPHVKSTLTPTEKYKQYIGPNPSQDFKKTGQDSKLYAKWLKEQADLAEKNAGTVVPFENKVIDKQKKTIKEAKEVQEKVKVAKKYEGLTEKDIKAIEKEMAFSENDRVFYSKIYDFVEKYKVNNKQQYIKELADKYGSNKNVYEKLLIEEKRAKYKLNSSKVLDRKQLNSVKDYTRLIEPPIVDGDPERCSEEWFNKYFKKEKAAMSSSDYSQFQIKIKEAPDFFQDYWALAGDEFKIHNLDTSGGFDDLNRAVSSTSAYYRSSTKSVVISLKKDAMNSECGKFSTFFHETGHALDDAYGSFNVMSNNSKFKGILENEISAFDFDRARDDMIWDSTSSGVQDVFHGITGKRIRWGHGTKADGSDYWGNSHKDRVTRTASEAWANISGSFSNGSRLEWGLKYMPDSTYEYYKEVKEAVNNRKTRNIILEALK